MGDPDGSLVFVEVRYRRSDNFGSAAESVSLPKQRRIRLAASHYLNLRPRYRSVPCRFDVLALQSHPAGGREQLQWIKNAFY